MSKSTIKIKTKPNALKNAIKNSTININCPNCNNQFQITGNQVGNRVPCPFCKTLIYLEDNNFSSELNKLQRSFDKIFK